MCESANNKTPHPLVRDNWRSDDEAEFTQIHSFRIADVTRAADSIRSLARLVRNSLGEPDMSGAQPLDRGTEMALLDGLYCLGDYIYMHMEETRYTADQIAGFEQARESENE